MTDARGTGAWSGNETSSDLRIWSATAPRAGETLSAVRPVGRCPRTCGTSTKGSAELYWTVRQRANDKDNCVIGVRTQDLLILASSWAARFEKEIAKSYSMSTCRRRLHRGMPQANALRHARIANVRPANFEIEFCTRADADASCRTRTKLRTDFRRDSR